MTVIVVSGLPCTGSSTIASLLAQKLAFRFFSVGAYYKKKSQEHLGGRTETDQALQFLQNREGASADFHLDLDELQRGIAQQGNVVIDGKLSIHLLQGLWDFSVWITASYDVRAERLHQRDGISVNDAIEKIKQRECLERKLWSQIYEFDYVQQEKEASLVIDTTNKKPEEIVQMIITAIKKKT
ncbi:MAG: cytidylate kinase family protein [Candidatus Aenigmarchaeota archaeon]|nr:cytidylate kinase family protein [Candidatus Aenigmarchaeota archaeon]